MAEKSEYEIISGDEREMNKKLLLRAANGWKPLFMATIPSGMSTTLYVMLERQTSIPDRYPEEEAAP